VKVFTAFYSLFSLASAFIALAGLVAAIVGVITMSRISSTLTSAALETATQFHRNSIELNKPVPYIAPMYAAYVEFDDGIQNGIPVVNSTIDAVNVVASHVGSIQDALSVLEEEIDAIKQSQKVLIDTYDHTPLNLSRVLNPYPFVPARIVPFDVDFNGLYNAFTLANSSFYGLRDNTYNLSYHLNAGASNLHGHLRWVMTQVSLTDEQFFSSIYKLSLVSNLTNQYLNNTHAQNTIQGAVIIPGVFIALSFAILAVLLILFSCGAKRHGITTQWCCSCTAMIPLSLLTVASIVFLMATTPFCTKTGTVELFNPSKIPEDYTNLHPNYTSNVNITYNLLRCTGNKTLYNAAVEAGWLSDHLLNAEFIANLTFTLDVLKLCLNDSDGLNYYGKRLLPAIPLLQKTTKDLQESLADLTNITYVDLLTQVNNLEAYERDNDIKLTDLDSYIEKANHIVAKIDLKYSRLNISKLDERVYNDPRLTDAERKQLLAIYHSVHDMAVIFDHIVLFQQNITGWTEASRSLVNTALVNGLAKSHEQIMATLPAIGGLLRNMIHLAAAFSTVDQKPYVNNLTLFVDNWDVFDEHARCNHIRETVEQVSFEFCTRTYPSLIGVVLSFIILMLLLLALNVLASVGEFKYRRPYSEETLLLLQGHGRVNTLK
jgi:hypothetical protein